MPDELIDRIAEVIDEHHTDEIVNPESSVVTTAESAVALAEAQTALANVQAAQAVAESKSDLVKLRDEIACQAQMMEKTTLEMSQIRSQLEELKSLIPPILAPATVEPQTPAQTEVMPVEPTLEPVEPSLSKSVADESPAAKTRRKQRSIRRV